MKKFVKNGIVIQAVQITPETFGDSHPNPEYLVGVIYNPNDKSVTIPTLEGNMRGDIDDWIIRGVNGELYPCKPDIFSKTYSKAYSELEEEISNAINRASMENESDTPDYILSQFLMGCLRSWNEAIRIREQWYGRTIQKQGDGIPVPPR